MTLTEVTYNSNAGYEVVYACHGCRKVIPDNSFKYCPFCGVGLVKDGRPEGRLDLDQGDICGLIAIAITNGGFGKSGRDYMKDGKHYKVEGPEGHGEVWAAWKKVSQERKRKEREAEEQKRGGVE